MTPDFDVPSNRWHSDSKKWRSCDRDVLPLSFADMDFQSAPPIVQALKTRAAHGIYGYLHDPVDLQAVFADWLQQQYNWKVSPEAVVVMPEVIPGFNLACHATTRPGDGVLIQTPAYPPIIRAHDNCRLTNGEAELVLDGDGRYIIDWDTFEAAISDRTRIFILCNPQNPVGRAFDLAELEQMAAICLRHDMIICSDEVWCDLVYPGGQHRPIASLAPEIADQTITLMSPNKAFNLGGLKVSMAIITNSSLREQFAASRAGLASMSVNVMGAAAALSAYQDAGTWLQALLVYLEGNRDFICDYVADQMPGVSMTRPEATYIGWLDCRQTGIEGNPADFFLERGRVALVDGALFGNCGQGFVRLNFGCPRATLAEALDRMSAALQTL